MSGRYDYSNKKINAFLGELGSSAVSPGGGAAAALTGALGASLLEMTVRINAERERKKAEQKNISKEAALRIKKIISIRSELTSIMEKDTQAFLALSAFPKEQRRGLRYVNALKKAASVPMGICLLSHEALGLGQVEVSRTSAWLASDLAEAGLLLEAAFHAGKLNVEINLKFMDDVGYAAAVRADIATKEADVTQRAIQLAGVAGS